MIHIISVGSDAFKIEHLKRSLALCKLNASVLVKEEWGGYIDKITNIMNLIKNIPDNDIICVIDAYDVLAFCKEVEIIRKFKSLNCNLIISSELNLYPERYRDQYDHIYSNKDIPTKYNYVNAGGYIGYKHALDKLFQWKSIAEMKRICDDGGDQNYFTEYYIEHFGMLVNSKKMVDLDRRQLIFQSMYKVDCREFAIMSGRLYNTVLKTFPCFVHFNGHNYHNMKIIDNDNNKTSDVQDFFMEKMTDSLISHSWHTLNYRPSLVITYNGIEESVLPQI